MSAFGNYGEAGISPRHLYSLDCFLIVIRRIDERKFEDDKMNLTLFKSAAYH